MRAVIGLSLPELIILRKVLKLRLIALFVQVVAVGIILTGLLFNRLLSARNAVRNCSLAGNDY